MALFKKSTGTGPAPLDGVDVVLADLDGVVYRGPNPVPHAVESLNALASAGIRSGYITNNASRTDEQVAQHLRDLGLSLTAQDVVTSPQAAVRLLATKVAPGSLILVVGGDGLLDELTKGGFRVTRSADDEPDAVIQGFAPHVGWEHLAEASFALARDIPWVATNQDWTIPVARGIAPGNGTLVSAVHTAVQKLPLVAGKPEKAIFDEAVRRFDATKALFIGDRLDTDIKGADNAGMTSAFVLTGVDRPKQLIAAPPGQRPDFILTDLRELSQPYPKIVTERPQAEHAVARVGDAQVTVRGIDVIVDRAGTSPINLLRAGCAAVAASEKLIYALRVPEVLYSELAS